MFKQRLLKGIQVLKNKIFAQPCLYMMIHMAAYFLFVSSVHDFIEKQNVLCLFIGRATRQNALNSVYMETK